MANLEDVNLTVYLPPTDIDPYFEAKAVLTRCDNAIGKYFENCIATGASHKEILQKFEQELRICVEPYQKELDRDGKAAVVGTLAVLGALGAVSSIYSAAVNIYDKVSGKK